MADWLNDSAMSNRWINDISTSLLQNADITWDRNGLPRSRTYDDIYFSVNNPLEESRHVFINGNHLGTRLPQVTDRPFIIGECGFGFGLNFLLTVEQFSRTAPESARLHYISCELHPVRLKDLKRYYANLPSSLLTLAAVLLRHYPEQGKGLHRFQFSYRQRFFTLDLVYDEATKALRGLSMPAPAVDAWYLDGFAPSRNDDMWQPRLFREIAAHSKAGTTLASYSVAGAVRRSLESVGFQIEKSPGFGNKRHMLSGRFEKQSPPQAAGWQWPWPGEQRQPQRVAVIGAGLAGCATAHALAMRGIPTTLIEAQDTVAAGSSGNPRGILHFSPARQLTPAARLRLQAYSHALQHYAVLAGQHDIGWQPGGVLQLAMPGKEQLQWQGLADAGRYDASLFRWVSREQAQTLAGVTLPAGGLFFPGAGSLNPAALCQALSQTTGITLHTQTRVTGMTAEPDGWTLALNTPDSHREAHFDAVVVCSNPFARDFEILPDYPLVANHGQTDTYTVRDTRGSNDTAGIVLPKTVVCHKGYAVAWKAHGSQQLMTGGSFAQGHHDEAETEMLGKKNLALLASMLPDLAAALTAAAHPCQSRTGTRVTTPDFLPLIGPVEDSTACRQIYAALSRNARKPVTACPDYLPGLYINAAHGANGLTTTPLAGEYLAALICGEPLPILHEDIQAIHPLRYLVRDLKKQQA